MASCGVETMATEVNMKHKETGLSKTGYIGFSWTTLFFGAFPALLRGDYPAFLGAFAIIVVLGLITAGIGGLIAMFIWAFMYNKQYTRMLIEKGYEFSDTKEMNASAAAAVGQAA